MHRIIGFGSLARVEEILSKYASARILLVTGKNSYEACGAKAALEDALANYHVKRYSDFDVNPKLEDGIRGAQIAKDFGADLILAVGGGSPMDVAKLIKAFLPDIENAKEFVVGAKPLPSSSLPLICVPTTAGSGSEATHFAVVYIGAKKYSLANQALLPNAAILDGQLLKSAPAYQRAINGLDALAQATEGAWAVKSTADSRILSYQAIEALYQYLPSILNDNEPKALQSVLVAAHQAGQVINTTKTTAAHAFSYAFTSLYNVPHGHAVWLTLPAIFALHMEAPENSVIDPRGWQHLQGVMERLAQLFGINSVASAEMQLKSFMSNMKVEPLMRNVGANTKAKRSEVASKVNKERLGNNPMALSDNDVSRIFQLEKC